MLQKENFKTYFDRFFDGVRNYIYYKCGDAHLATDIAQEAFLTLWEKKDKFEETHIKALLYKIASDKLVSEWRKQKPKQTLDKFEMILNSDNPEEKMEYNDLKETFELALSALPVKQREVFLMNRSEELSYKEIAERLNLSIKAVEKRMSQALGFLKQKIKH